VTKDFLIAGGLYSVTALRENDQERVTVYTEHRLTKDYFLIVGGLYSVTATPRLKIT
jgi:hypothetical protein